MKTFYRIKLLENTKKVMWASIDCLNNSLKYIVSTDLNNEFCSEDYLLAIKEFNC